MILAVLVFTFGFARADDKLERKFNLESGKKVSIDNNTGGSIEVTGWDQALLSVVITADRDISEYQIDFREKSSGVSVEIDSYRSGRGSHDVKIKVNLPRKSDLDLETMGGDLSITNVNGEIDGETMGGDINLADLSGTIDITTMGGDIDIRDSELDGKVSTMGGDITFNNVSGPVKGSTMGGDVKYKGKNQPVSKNKEVKISTMGGDIEVHEAPSGAAVSTMGGDIHISSAGKYANASTMGGDIELGKVDGSIEASTMGGDITATMVGDPEKGERDVDLSSMGGDITLTVPAGLSMRFDIKLTFTKNSSRSYKIISDFPIKTEESKEWDYDAGTPRKYIFGSGNVKDGKNKIKIETINGNIYIKKGQ